MEFPQEELEQVNQASVLGAHLSSGLETESEPELGTKQP